MSEVPRAAVSVLLECGPRPKVLLGRRRIRESDPWSGHLALPGGRREIEDTDAMDTALRECAEESGIVLSRERVAGALEPVPAGRRVGRPMVVQPFVAFVDGFRPDRAGDGEMDQWHDFALDDLDRQELRTVVRAPDGALLPGVATPIGVLWGMTLSLLERVWRQPLLPDVDKLWLDFDGTLYPSSHPLVELVDRRITLWVARERGIPLEEADLLRRDLYRRHGNTLKGMMSEGDVDPSRYLDFVFDLPEEAFPGEDPELADALGRIGIPWCVFTNAREDYVRRGLARLGVEGCGRIHDIASFGWNAKPHPGPYHQVLEREADRSSRVVFLDDRPENLAPARALGVRGVLVDEFLESDWRGPDGTFQSVPWSFQIRSLSHLPRLLLPRLGS
ncbi:MAG TPA: NUDIX domain-containing protein [Fibrobacteria bacterium]|nr:NUDIX domain-containing protein [Fibrobacteria bacterium]